jgi:hypothetical protein
MRYLWSSLLLLLLLLGPLAPAAQAARGKRPAGKKSSIASVRKTQKYNRKPNVYNAKRNRPMVVKKPHWWQRR